MQAAAQMRNRLEASRSELLDLGLRNPLLNYRCLRARGVEVVDEKPAEVFRLLVREKKPFTFLSAGGDQDFYNPPPEGTGEARFTDSRLQTELNVKQLHARLLATYYAARTFVEEQGVNILYLALGMLRWTEIDEPEKPYRAPLVLIPVELERSNARERFSLRYTDEELGGNDSLAAKLKADFGLAYPELPDPDDLDVGAYFDALQQAVSSRPGWSVERDTIALGFFSFGKFLMYRDLDPKNWPEESSPADHPVLAALLDDGGFQGVASPYSDEEPVDRHTERRELSDVVDADSSQTLALLDAADRRNLVIQGPPGTGKSQTIANLIADAIGAHQRVLFVAEKMAALEVVKRRLDQVGIGDACLELHSNKTNKKTVLAELKRTLALGRPRLPALEAELSLLESSRAQLNAYCEAVNTGVGKSEVTPVDAYGRLARLARSLPASAPRITVDGMAGWPAKDYARRHALAEETQAVLRSTGIPEQHPFWGSKRSQFMPGDAEKLGGLIEAGARAVSALAQASSAAAALLDIAAPATPAESKVLSDACRRLLDAPSLDGFDLQAPEWKSGAGAIRALLETAESAAGIRERYEEKVIPEAWTEDLLATRQSLAAHGRKWWNFLIGDYRRAKARMLGLCRGVPPGSLETMLALVDTILDVQRKRRDLQSGEAAVRKLYQGPLPATAKDWTALGSRFDFVSAIHAEEAAGKLPAGAIIALAGSVDRTRLEELSAPLAAGLADHRGCLAGLFSFLELDTARTDRLRASGFAEQLCALDAWRNDLAEFPPLVSLNQRCRLLGEDGLAALAPLATGWDGAGQSLGAVLERAWLEALLEKAFSERAALAQFDGGGQSEVVARFRRLDQLQLDYHRASLALAHWKSLPAGAEGQMGVLRREFEKKTRHLPIRRLMLEAGNAVQAIKPVLMMSPLSVANFLTPGALRFDLVVFDEASQMRPVDAWGAIARARQAVVVGDSKQLPPSSFFDSLTGSEEQDEDNVAADLESILSLFASKGAPQRMLRWHYRSRHESLIAVSNREFYHNQLFIFPSPDASRSQLGLVFRHLPGTAYDRGKTRTNAQEARAVAEAVMAHAARELRKAPEDRWTLGVAAFSIPQAEAITDELELLRRENPDCEEYFNYHPYERVFVKNLENVQGDERDVILISIGYGRTAEGYVAMDFGPLNRAGGERRLNVLITRARRRSEVFTNLTADDIDLSRSSSEGVRALKTFLLYAQTGRMEISAATDRPPDSPFETEVREALEAAGHTVEGQVGCAGYFLDLAVVDPQQAGRYLLGIECDGATYHRARSARDRDRLRQTVLEGLGWRIHRIWSTDWFRNPERELRNVIGAIETARAAAPAGAPVPKVPIVRDDVRPEQQGAEPYRLANLKIDLRGQDLHTISTERLAAWIAEVVRVEGPVHEDQAMERVADAAGVARIGNRIGEALHAAISTAEGAGVVRRQEKFLWPKAMTTPCLRSRADAPAALRKLDLVAPEEIGEAIKAAAAAGFGLAEDQIAPAACRQLGFTRASDEMRGRVDQVVQEMLAQKKLVRQGPWIVAP